jgi:hypothetical protein
LVTIGKWESRIGKQSQRAMEDEQSSKCERREGEKPEKEKMDGGRMMTRGRRGRFARDEGEGQAQRQY